MAGWFEARKQKKQAIAKKMIADSRVIMDSVESSYRTTRSYISKYESEVEFNARSACKSAKKAYRSAIAESEIVQIYGRAMELLDAQDLLETKKIQKLDADYMASMARGKFRKARKIANKLDIIANSDHDPSDIRITLDRSHLDEGSIRIIISNRSERAIIIEQVSCSSGTKQLDIQGVMSEPCHPGCQTTRDVGFVGDKALGLTVTVTYESGFEKRAITRQFALMNKV